MSLVDEKDLAGPTPNHTKTISNIHAIARYLLNMDFDDAEELFVGVQPCGPDWRVQVKYADFVLTVRARALDEALEKALRKLTDSVVKRLEDGTNIIARIREDTQGG